MDGRLEERAARERKKTWQLSDIELLEVIRGRGRELEVVRAFTPLIRMFETVAKNQPELAKGLNHAVALTKLHAQRYAPGDPTHPFPNFGIQQENSIKVAA